MVLRRKEVVDALKTSAKRLRQGFDMHCCLMASVLEEGVDDLSVGSLQELCPKRSRELRLEKAIEEAIEVLEESRKAFKSKQLEKLRKELTQALIGTK